MSRMKSLRSLVAEWRVLKRLLVSMGPQLRSASSSLRRELGEGARSFTATGSVALGSNDRRKKREPSNCVAKRIGGCGGCGAARTGCEHRLRDVDTKLEGPPDDQ